VTFKRRKSRRVRMAEAIRRECDPFAFSLGFRHPRKGDWNRWLTTRRNVYIRWRGMDFDEVVFNWGRWGAAFFRMHVARSRADPAPYPPDGIPRTESGGLVYAWAGPIAPICRDKFGPWRTVESVVALTNQCFAELDGWLRDDIVGPHLHVGGAKRITATEGWLHPLYRTWGDPFLDPESDIARSESEAT
jgi:hypothetical protein